MNFIGVETETCILLIVVNLSVFIIKERNA